MRAGVFISALSHVLLVALALFGTPKLFDEAMSPSIEVDLVRADEIEAPKEKPPEKPPEKSTEWNPLPQKSEPQAQTATPPEKPAEQPAAPPQQKQTAPTQQAQGPQVPSPAPQQQQQQQQSKPSIFDPASIPALLNLPTAPDSGFDSEATVIANLTNDERAAFRAHLKKCWKLPGGVSPTQTTRVVMRIYLQRNGMLSNEPQLIEASASREGPLVMQAAIRTLKECQPYAFLPPEKYKEWRMLDLSFSPRDMAGG